MMEIKTGVSDAVAVREGRGNYRDYATNTMRGSYKVCYWLYVYRFWHSV